MSLILNLRGRIRGGRGRRRGGNAVFGSVADSSDSLAAVITHFIYASQRKQERRESLSYYRAATAEHSGC